MGQDQRRFRRAEVRVPARIQRVGDEGPSLPATITNLGPEGAFCASPEVIPQGTAVVVSFGIADINMAVNAEGIVRWVSRREGAQGLGIHFTRITPEERDAVYRYVLIKHAESRGLI